MIDDDHSPQPQAVQRSPESEMQPILESERVPHGETRHRVRRSVLFRVTLIFSMVTAVTLTAIVSASVWAPTEEEIAWAALGRARHYHDDEQYGLARKWYDKTIHLQPTWTHSYRQKAWCYLDQQQYQEAQHTLALALAIDPGNTDILIDQAFAFTKLQQFQSALVNLDQVILSDATNLRALSMRLDAHLKLGHTQRAQADRLTIRSLVSTDVPNADTLQPTTDHELHSKGASNAEPPR